MAVSDVHIGYAENRGLVESIEAVSPEDWLILGSDVGEIAADIIAIWRLMRSRFAKVIWVPGNHELWTAKQDPLRLRGDARYRYLVAAARDVGVLTPEDPYPVWVGEGGPVVVAPLFVPYDYTFRPAGTTTRDEALDLARSTGVVCTDEWLLHADPYPRIDDWSRARVTYTEQRLAALDPAVPPVLVNHWPLVRQPCDVLRYPEFALWCGTTATADWHLRFRAAAAVYGHLHIPRTTWYDDVRFEEVSMGYPRERAAWEAYGRPYIGPRQILPYVPRPERKRVGTASGDASATASARG
ncbi:metallophosphoesterase family protein [Candidatus Frankia nodulisporulans]|uniref:metallophosphoesterase family protein n=1 Tax=Candidatus Frankia nodulisporulans TaxID=2060052 RepID=UPI0013D2F56B|nr:metallophosphoesterase [Candidatus Frankia nodulisporulans]